MPIAKKESRRTKLSKTVVEKLEKPERGQYFVWDSDLKGFGVRVTPGSKSYVVQDRVKGRTVRFTIGSHGKLTAETARTEAKIKLGEMEKGNNLNDEKRIERAKSITLEEVWNEYKANRNLRKKTLEAYEGALRRCLSDWLRKPITFINKDMVEKRCQKIASGPNGTGSAQALQAMRILCSLINYAASICEDTDGRSLIAENPVAIARRKQKKVWPKLKRRQTVIKKTQLKAWFDAVNSLNNETIRDCLLLLLFTGLRRNEAAKLMWANIDLDDKVIELSDDQTKNHEVHHIPMSSFVYELLQRRYDRKKDDAIYVFPGYGKAGHLVEMKASTKVVIDKSGVKFMIHDLRRTFITIAERVELPHYALKRLANHKTKSDVTSGYIVADVERLREPVERITNFILEQLKETPSNDQPEAPIQTARLTDDYTRLVAVN